jgi:AmmeMemoRadiSam system protein A
MRSEAMIQLTEKDKNALKKIARKAVIHAVTYSKELPVSLSEFPATLHGYQNTFVTLKYNGKVIGCMGSLEADKPLVNDVVHHAFSASYYDSRFPDPKTIDPEKIEIHISLLSPIEEIKFSSEQGLLSVIRPGKDGLLIREGQQSGTFLPAVWDSIPAPERFLKELKRKAGLPTDYWSDTIKAYRYITDSW